MKRHRILTLCGLFLCFSAAVSAQTAPSGSPEGAEVQEEFALPSEWVANILRMNVRELRELALQLVNENERLTDEHNRLRQQVLALEMEIDLLMPQIRKPVLPSSPEPDSRQTHNATVHELKLKRRVLEKEVGRLRDKVDHEKKTLLPLSTQVETLEKKHAALEEQHSRLLSEKQQALGKTQEEIAKIQNRILETDAVQAAAGQDLLADIRQGVLSDEDLRKLENENRKLARQISRVRKDNARLSRRVEKLKEEIQRGVERKERPLEEAREKKDRLEEERQALEGEIGQVETAIAGLETELAVPLPVEALTLQIKELEETNVHLKERVRDLRQVVQDLKKDMAMIKDLIDLKRHR